MSINDTFIVIPLFPLLVLFYFVMRDYMSWALLALVMASLGWAYDARLIRSLMMSLKTREFTRTAVFSGMPAHEIMLKEHLPFVLPIVFSTTLNNMNWSIGLEVTLSVLGFTDLDTPTVGTMLFWANQHSAMVSGVWWWYVFPTLFITLAFIGLFLLAVSLNEYIDPRSRLSRMGGGVGVMAGGGARSCGSATCAPTTRCAYFGIDREVRAVDDITLDINKNEIYGLAGESSSGKTSFIKTIAAANRPPLNVVGGSVQYSFLDRDIHKLSRSCARRGAVEAHLLHHAGLDERAEPGPPGAPHLHRLRLPPHRQAAARVQPHRARHISAGFTSSRRCSTPIRMSFRAGCGSGWRSRWRRSAGPSSSSPTSPPPRSTSSCRRTCWR